MAKAVKHKERAHAVLSASGADRWLNCPGSIALSAKAPVPVESEYAKEGTTAHECLEFLLRNREKLDAAVAVAAGKYPANMVRHARASAQYVLDRAAALESPEILIETKVDLTFVAPEMFGTLDIALVEDFGRLIIADFKYGAGIAVNPEDNAQLLYYALGIAKLYDFNFSSLELIVIQPRAWHESGETIRSWVTDIETLKKWQWRFADGAAATKVKDAPLAAGKWCKFCAAGPICPEISTAALRQARAVFDDGFTTLSLPQPAEQPLPDLANILRAADKIEDWIKNVREYAEGLLRRGEKVDGYKLVYKRPQRKWVDEIKLEAQAKELFGELAFTEPKLLSPAQLEAKAKKLWPRYVAWVDENTASESSGLTMVGDDDRRPAVTPAAEAFATPMPALPPKKVSSMAVKKISKVTKSI